MPNLPSTTSTATLAGGCFWCTEALYQKIPGVLSILPGYSGGHLENPSYEAICTGTTGHAEAVQIQFDTSLLSYTQLLEWFWEFHDPTTLNRQGNDVGPQYRSVIFYHDAEQKAEAETSIQKLAQSKKFDDPIVTELVPFTQFYPAEEYHQNYYNSHQNQPYCAFVIRPKLAKLAKLQSTNC